jgi:hypothetical protein
VRGIVAPKIILGVMQQALGDVFDVAVIGKARVYVRARWRSFRQQYVVEEDAITAECHFVRDHRARDKGGEWRVSRHARASEKTTKLIRFSPPYVDLSAAALAAGVYGLRNSGAI